MVMVNQGENSKLPGVREIAQRIAVLLADISITWKPGPAPVWWKRTWKAIRSAVRSDRRRADRDVIEEEQIDFMQRELVLPIGANRMPDEYAFCADDPYWMARMLQRSLVQQYGKLGSKKVKIGRPETWLFSMIEGLPPRVMDAMNRL